MRYLLGLVLIAIVGVHGYIFAETGTVDPCRGTVQRAIQNHLDDKNGGLGALMMLNPAFESIAASKMRSKGIGTCYWSALTGDEPALAGASDDPSTHARVEIKIPDASELVEASIDGDVSKVKALLAQKADVNGRDGKGRIALIEAAKKSRVEVVETLLASKADVNASEANGRTALYYALMRDLTVPRLLLEAGAKVNDDINKPYDSAFATTVMTYGSQQKRGSKQDLASEFRPLVRALLAAKVEPKTLDAAFTYAVLYGLADAVQVLVDAGANVNTVEPNGGTGLMSASTSPFIQSEDARLALIKVLVLAKSDVNATKKDGTTALMVAAENGRLPIVRALIATGADVNARRTDQSMALQLASSHGHKDVVQVLASAGAK
jgi:ankyrin repeat protein